jgi:hypothetical protein
VTGSANGALELLELKSLLRVATAIRAKDAFDERGRVLFIVCHSYYLIQI